MSDEPINVDPPDPNPKKIGCGKSEDRNEGHAEPSRQERANKLRGELKVLIEAARGFLDNNLKKAFTAIDKARTLEDQIATLEHFKDDEEHRLWLIRQAENGYH